MRHSCVQLTLSNVFDKSRLTTHTQARQQLKTDQLQHSHSPSVLPTCTLGEIRVPLLLASCPKHSQCATNVLYSKRMLIIGLKPVGNFAFWALPNIETKRYAQNMVHTLLSKQRYIMLYYRSSKSWRKSSGRYRNILATKPMSSPLLFDCKRWIAHFNSQRAQGGSIE